MNSGKRCANISCSLEVSASAASPLVCEFCKARSYCCKDCRTQDWKKGHSKDCETAFRLHIEEAEKRCPFLTDGVLFSQGETKGMRCKLETILDTYEKAKIPGRPTSALGKGSYGEVFLMRNKSTGKYVAMKAIRKQFIGNPGMLKALTREIEIHKSLMHDNIIQLLEHCEDSKHIYILMEYAAKGSLFRHIRTQDKLSEKESFYYFVQACNAVHFLHKHQLMHRDIKPENMLISGEGQLKLCDFGCCTPYESGGRKTFCGTLEYMAPEVIRRGGYKEKADVWSLGVLLYEMLHGYAPFRGVRDQDTIQKIMEDKLDFEEEVKLDAREVIEAMVNADPTQRPCIVEVLEMPWAKRMQKELGIKDREVEMASESSKTSATSRTLAADRSAVADMETMYSNFEGESMDRLRQEYSKQLLVNVSMAETRNEIGGSFSSNDYEVQRSESLLKAVDYLDKLDIKESQSDIDKCIKELEEENNILRRICNSYMDKKKERKKDEGKKAIDEVPNEILYNYAPMDYKESMSNIAKSIKNMKADVFSRCVVKPAKVTLIKSNKNTEGTKSVARSGSRSALGAVWDFVFSVGEIKGV
eukprot:TRINITY_DN1528_c0_g1_i10.p1 TRINITY_DN1528_c0_g1~~TRINITY_DN1528_c0_g1_i10.p1  ORF type:complete len:587 (+),score=170.79 TRINITY_DN1528_c0_g1_i10:160-1920(+)